MKRRIIWNLFLITYLSDGSVASSEDVVLQEKTTTMSVTADGELNNHPESEVIPNIATPQPPLMSTNVTFPTPCDDVLDLKCVPWHELSDQEHERHAWQWAQASLDRDLGWYYNERPYWDDLEENKRTALFMLGYTAERWNAYEDNPCEGFDRALAELRPWSRLTEQEREAATLLGLNEYTWFTKEPVMNAWQPQDGEITWQGIPQDRPLQKLMPNNGFHTEKLNLDIQEFKAITFDALAQIEAELRVHQTDSNEEENDEIDHDDLDMPIGQFINEIKDGKKFYAKYENGHEYVTSQMVGDLDVVQVLKQYLENTTLADYARIGPKYEQKKEHVEDYVQLNIGGPSSSVKQMHLDMQSFTFLYVVQGKKRIRLLPNDQRTSQNFTVGFNDKYSITTGYDLLHEPLSSDGVEFILSSGEAAIVPYHSWHAEENLEATISFAWIRDFQFTKERYDCPTHSDEDDEDDDEDEDDEYDEEEEAEEADEEEEDEEDEEEEEEEFYLSDALENLEAAKRELINRKATEEGSYMLNLFEQVRIILSDLTDEHNEDDEKKEEESIVQMNKVIALLDFALKAVSDETPQDDGKTTVKGMIETAKLAVEYVHDITTNEDQDEEENEEDEEGEEDEDEEEEDEDQAVSDETGDEDDEEQNEVSEENDEDEEEEEGEEEEEEEGDEEDSDDEEDDGSDEEEEDDGEVEVVDGEVKEDKHAERKAVPEISEQTEFVKQE